MTQRIFDTKNEKDIKELFNLLPDDCRRLIKQDCFASIAPDRWQPTIDKILVPLMIDWGNLTEIKRPVDYSKYIGKLGWFSRYEGEWEYIDVLDKTGDVKNDGVFFWAKYLEKRLKFFKPLTLEEAKQLIAED